ncbi:MAG: tRNA (guanosine(37)-N1)-methyltransferase TrmD [Firmicutes bacterium]|nr:tRNA (guanosine(37)-N1)-methyltransferase TrmD [Bacillota bacterium]MDH7494917.1 tRNA (guanosine(37)-N1)-methyltransferase TrmD [Bacillota bacterium]
MRIDVLTLFPGMFSGPLSESIVARARERGLVEVHIHDIRDFAQDKHRVADDYPFGGGAGMVMKPEPIFAAVEHVTGGEAGAGRVILMSPQGAVFTQEMAVRLAREPHLVVICGHYEGVDERVREALVDEEISIGDYVLTGGELPAMVVIDALTRLVPGVLEEESVAAESFTSGLLDYPQYTRPREFRGMTVPEVLVSGDHEKVRIWRRRQALARTLERRPDLLRKAGLTPEDLRLLQEIERDRATEPRRAGVEPGSGGVV